MIKTAQTPAAYAPPREQTFGQRLRKDLRINKYVYIMSVPILLYFLIFHYIPLAGITIAFKDYNSFKGFFASEWVGLQNFVEFFTGPYAGRIIFNTIWLNVLLILFGFPAPIILTLLINEIRSSTFKKVFQTVSYMPYFISLVVVCGMITMFCRSTGIVSDLLAIFGVPRDNLLMRPELFRSIYVVSNIWQGVGWGTIIYLATLSSVDPSLYEAASMDGAGRLRRIVHITIPALIPVIAVQLIMTMGGIIASGFEKTILLYNPMTMETADIIASFVYRRGLQEMDYSYGTAVSLFTSIVNMIFLVIANVVSRKVSEESLW